MAVTLMTAPILLSRLLGLALDGASSPYHKAYLTIEFIGVGLALILLRKVPNS